MNPFWLMNSPRVRGCLILDLGVEGAQICGGGVCVLPFGFHKIRHLGEHKAAISLLAVRSERLAGVHAKNIKSAFKSFSNT